MFWFLRSLYIFTFSFWQHQKGAIAVISALVMTTLFGFAGASIDYGKSFTYKHRLQQALDAAALAAAYETSEEACFNEATKFFNLNGEFFENVSLSELSMNMNTEDHTIHLSRSVEVPTHLLKVIGKNSITVSASSTAKIAKAGYEVALVLDNSGSMSFDPESDILDCSAENCNRMQSVKYASKILLDTLFNGEETLPLLNVSITPYSGNINIGSNNESWTTGVDQSLYGDVGWKGCIYARHANGNDLNDEPPSVEAFQPSLYKSTYGKLFPRLYRSNWIPSVYSRYLILGDNNWVPGEENESAEVQNQDKQDIKGPNKNCPQPILPLTNTYSTLLDNIKSMNAWRGGGTMGSGALAWGWRTISPKWRGLWQTSNNDDHPADYNSPNVQKILIMMTDGGNNMTDSGGECERLYSTSQYQDRIGSSPSFYIDNLTSSQQNSIQGTVIPSISNLLSSYSLRGVCYGAPGWPDRYTSVDDTDVTYYGRLQDGMIGVDTRQETITAIDNKMAAICENIKEDNVILYTITFGSSINNSTKEIYRGCATKEANYYHAPDGEDLVDAFTNIAGQLKGVRLSQ